MSPISPALAVQAQRSAEIAVELVQAGMAPPDLLNDLVQQMPPGDERRAFMRGIQKAIERGAGAQLSGNT